MKLPSPKCGFVVVADSSGGVINVLQPGLGVLQGIVDDGQKI